MHKVINTIIVCLLLISTGCLYLHWQTIQKIRAEREVINVQNTDNLHAVRCISEGGEMNTYAIYIPPEVAKGGHKALEAFSKGYCSSLERSYLP